MDNTREKLIELTNDVLRCLPWGEISLHTAEDIADHLIANGVTIAEEKHGRWVIRTKGRHISWAECSECGVCGSQGWKRCPVCETKMDLPQPPKGE